MALWTLVPALTHHNLPLDVIEQTAWGAEWQLGYFKHPPMAAWLTEHGIPHIYVETAGDHSWPVWRDYWARFLPLLFRP